MKLEINDVYKKYDKHTVLDSVSFVLEPGIYGLLGANGAGKTTLMKIICGVIKPDNGEIKFNNQTIIDDLEGYYGNLGFLPQDFKYYPEFTGLNFMLYIASLKGVSSKKAKQECIQLLELVGLIDVKNKKIKKYSGGMRQRLGIAQAMISDPKILILDEPTVGLDPKERISFRNLLSSFSNDKIVILSTHIVSDVEYIADEILILKEGHLKNRGNVLELIKEIDNMVWECIVPYNLVSDFKNKFIISNQKHEADGSILLRIISQVQPTSDSNKVHPSLEDLYLFYFNQEVSYEINS